MPEKHVKESKFLSFILRHDPGSIGLEMTKEGWVLVEWLIKLSAKKQSISLKVLKEIVESDDKGRYEFSADGMYIRATQGHSIKDLDLGFKEEKAPDYLYHGTAEKYLQSISLAGIIAGQRHHVHLSDNTATAMTVGSRHGRPITIVINAKKMQADGIKFYKSNNGVWLTDKVDRKYFSSILSLHDLQP